MLETLEVYCKSRILPCTDKTHLVPCAANYLRIRTMTGRYDWYESLTYPTGSWDRTARHRRWSVPVVAFRHRWQWQRRPKEGRRYRSYRRPRRLQLLRQWRPSWGQLLFLACQVRERCGTAAAQRQLNATRFVDRPMQCSRFAVDFRDDVVSGNLKISTAGQF